MQNGFWWDVAIASSCSSVHGLRCPLCPFRTFFGGGHRARCVDHIRKYHSLANQFCCSGTKQIKVIAAIHDNDKLQGLTTGKYLERSAQIMHSCVKPPVAVSQNNIDKDIRLVLTERGPEYWSLSAVEHGVVCRRVRNLYYTKGFAEILFKEIILHDAKVMSMITRLQLRAMEAGSELANLFPGHSRFWWPLIEDVMQSNVVTGAGPRLCPCVPCAWVERNGTSSFKFSHA